jgi:flagellar motor switch protein FliG
LSGKAQSPEGARKTAALLLAMGRPLAQRMVARFEPDELRLIANSARTMPPLNRSVVDALVEDFARHFVDQVGTGPADEELNAIIGGGMDESLQPPGDLSDAPPIDPWPSVMAASSERLAALLATENPCVIAAALSRFAPAAVARIIEQLPERLRLSAINAMVDASAADPMVLEAIGQHLSSGLAVEDKGAAASINRKRVAAVLNGLVREEADMLIDGIGETDPDEASAIRALLFDFSDVIRLDAAARSTLFDAVNVELVMSALSGADSAIKDAVLAALGARARRMVEAELQNGTPPKPDRITEARRRIADMALELADAGRITLAAPEAGNG